MGLGSDSGGGDVELECNVNRQGVQKVGDY